MSRLFLLLIFLGLLLSACTPLYIPPVPEGRTAQPQARLELSGALGRTGAGGLELGLHLLNVPEAGWLAVQWFSPHGNEVASDAIWIAPRDVGVRPSLFLPGQNELTPGQWRAVLSFEGAFIRQFALEVGQ